MSQSTQSALDSKLYNQITRKEQIQSLRHKIKKLNKKLKASQHYRRFVKYRHKISQTQIKLWKNKYIQTSSEIKSYENSAVHQLDDLQKQIIEKTQQLNQFQKDSQQKQDELKKKYIINRATQELKEYQALINSDLVELGKLVYKEDFNQGQVMQQNLNDPNGQDNIQILEEKFALTRKRIIKAKTFSLLFVQKQEKKIQKSKDDIKEQENKRETLRNHIQKLYQQYQGSLIEQTKKEIELKELTKQIQELDKQLNSLREYAVLKQQEQVLLNQRAEFNNYTKNKQQVNQKILSNTEYLKNSVDDFADKLHINIQDDTYDFKRMFLDSLQKQLTAVQSMFDERQNFIQNYNQLKSSIEFEKNDEKMIQLQQKLVDYIPNIKQYSIQEVLKCLGENKQKQDQIYKDINRNTYYLGQRKNQLNTIQANEDEINKQILFVDKEIKNLQTKIISDNHKTSLVNLKFNDLKQKLEQTPQELQSVIQLIADIEYTINQIQELIKHVIDEEIAKNYQDFQQSHINNGANRPINSIYEEFKENIEKMINYSTEKSQYLKEQLGVLKNKETILQFQYQESSSQMQMTKQEIEFKKKEVADIKKQIILLKQQVQKEKVLRNSLLKRKLSQQLEETQCKQKMLELQFK